MEKRIIGLDYGEARTGVAVSDLLGITAQGVTSISHKSDKELIEKLRSLYRRIQAKKDCYWYANKYECNKGSKS